MSRRGSANDELTEIVKAEIDRVDGVLGPANGTPPLLMKALDGAPPVDVDTVLKAALHGPFTGSHSHPHPAMDAQGGDDTHEHEHSHDGDADHDHPHPVAKAGVVDCPTCDGSGGIMGGNRDCPDCENGKVTADKAAEMKKAQLSAAELNDLPDDAFAYIESGGEKDDEGKTTPRSKRHFAIHDKAHADNAAARIAQGAEFGEQAKPKVEAAQRKFGAKVEKADGEEMEPGSPAWEAQDAAALRAAAAQLADLRGRVANSRDREAQEDEPYDWDNASDLDCAVQAIECALGIVARLAFTEQTEALRPADDDMVKAGRRLSTKSIAAIKTARDHLTTLLGPDGEEPPTEEEDDVMNKALIAEALREQMPELATAVAKALQAGTPRVPTSLPEPAGTDMSAATGPVDAAARQQEQRLPGQNPPPEDPATPELDAEPAGGLPSGVLPPAGAEAAEAGGDMGRAKAAETATDANPSLVKSAPTEPLDVEAFAKSLLEPVMKSVQELVQPVADGLETVTKRLEAVEKQPMPGGPLLKGAPGNTPGAQFDWLNARREAGTPALPEGADADQMLKALESITDPVAKREITRRLAVSMHPVYRGQ